MEKVLNEISSRTTNSFGVNNVKLDLNIPSNLTFESYKTNYDIKSTKMNNHLIPRLGLEIDEYLNTDVNLDKYDVIKEPIILEYELNDNALVDVININADVNSEAIIIIVYRGNGFHYLNINNNVKENAKVSVSIINLMNDNSTNLISIDESVYEHAESNNTIINLLGSLKLTNYYSDLLGHDSKQSLNSVYYGHNNDLLDINYIVNNIGKNSNSNINTVGILDDEANKTLKMSIDFKSGCKGSIGEENEKCILLSDNAVTKSVPLLLCTEEDVQGVHAVATGKVDKDKVFYVMSRGFSEKDAIKTIINGDLNDIINNIDNEDIKEEIFNKIIEII